MFSISASGKLSLTNKGPTKGDVVVRTTKRKADAIQAGRKSEPSKRYKRVAGKDRQGWSTLENSERLTLAEHLSEHVSGSSAYLSQRQDPSQAGAIPSLASTTVRRLGAAFTTLFVNPSTNDIKQSSFVDEQKQLLRMLPSHISKRVLAAVLDNVPESKAGQAALSLIPQFINEYTDSFILPASVSTHFAVSPLLLASFRSATHLTHLDISSQSKLTDSQLAGVLLALPNLQSLCLRGCTQIGDKSALAVTMKQVNADKLVSLNLNYTAVSWKALAKVLARCRNLAVLKLAAVPGLTDANVGKMTDSMVETNGTLDGLFHVPLSKLRTLKLRSTAITELGLGRILTWALNLTRLDVSFTAIYSLDFLARQVLSGTVLPLEKLSLSGLTLRRGTLKRFLETVAAKSEETLSSLKTFKLGSLGVAAAQSTHAGEADVLNPPEAKALVKCLMRCKGLESLSLPFSPQLIKSKTTLRALLANVGRRCTFLDLSGAGTINADILTGLLGLEEDDWSEEVLNDASAQPIALQTLILDKTGIDDEALSILSHCTNLRSLHLGSAKISSSGLAKVIESCKLLHSLDVSGCRGIPTRYRRDAFTAFEDGALDGSDSD